LLPPIGQPRSAAATKPCARKWLESVNGRLAFERAVVKQACAAGMPLAEALEKFVSEDLRAHFNVPPGR
jgi:hypothetical protein